MNDYTYQRFENGYVPLFWHVKRNLYADAVQRYLDQFDKDQVKIFLFDDLKSEPQQVFDELLSFLGLPGFGIKVNLERKWNTSNELSFLAERFREAVEKLEKILKRDLKHWVSVPEKKSVYSNETIGSSE